MLRPNISAEISQDLHFSKHNRLSHVQYGVLLESSQRCPSVDEFMNILNVSVMLYCANVDMKTPENINAAASKFPFCVFLFQASDFQGTIVCTG